MPQFVKVAQTEEIPPGEVFGFEADGIKVAIVNVEGQFYALGGICPHEDGPLGEGYLDGSTLSCPWHGGEFEVKTGQALRPPVSGCVPTYPVRIQGNDIEVGLPLPAESPSARE